MTWLVLSVVLLAGLGGWGYQYGRRRSVLLRRTLPYLSRPPARRRRWRPSALPAGRARALPGARAGVPGLRGGVRWWPGRGRRVEAGMPEALDVLALAVDAGWQPRQGVEHLLPALDVAVAEELVRVLPPGGALLPPVLVARLGSEAGRCPQVLRLQRALASAPDGGEALAGLLRAQAADLRERRRRRLARRAGRRLALQVALVLLVQLPVTVLTLTVLVRSWAGTASWWAQWLAG